MQRRFLSGCLVAAMVLVCVLSLVACSASDQFTGSWGGAGMIKISKSGDTYKIHEVANPFGLDYQGHVENGKLIAKDGPATFTFTVDGNWLVRDGNMRYEKN